MKTLLLVDASSYLYRAFHALPDLRNRAGEPTGAIYGVINMLRRLVREEPADYRACVFDAKGKTFRDDWYPQYKATRTAMPDDLVLQIEPIHEAIAALGWPIVMIDRVEADDVIATLATQARACALRTVVSTGDKDLAQLVDESTTLVNTMSNETLDPASVVAKFGIPPSLIVDFLTLVGDAIDNVPGVDKVGPKTACKWLAQYGSLDGVIAHASEIGGVVGENLRRALDWLPMGRQLVTVKRDVELAVGPTDLAPRAPDDEKLAQLFERFEFKNWLAEVRASRHPEAKRTRDIDAPAARGALPPAGAGASPDADIAELVAGAAGPAAPIERRYECVLTQDRLDDWVRRISAAPLTAIDAKTTSLEPMTAQLVGISLAVVAGEACYIPLAHRYPGAPDQLSRDATLAQLTPWLQSAAQRKVGQNLKYDAHVFANHGVRLDGMVDDTLLESYVLESHRRHDLDDLALRHLGETMITNEQVAGKGAKEICFDEVALDRATEYAAEGVDITLRLHEKLAPEISAVDGLDHVYRVIELPAVQVLFAMERAGVLLDAPLLIRQSSELGAKLVEIERLAHEAAGQPFNLNSPKQIQELLFGKLALPVIKKTPSGTPSTDEDVLTELALDYPLPKLLLEHRSLSKLKSTYTDKLPKMINPRTGRVHTNYAQGVAVTGRLSSTEPNLQNIPVRTPEGRRIREAFIAAPGHMIVSADYSQIELRIMAHLSDDRGLLDAFAAGEDIHRATAAEIFGTLPDAVTSEQRRYAKVINFGLIYGMSAFGLAANLGIERAAAQLYIERYFTRYPGVADYMRRTRASAYDTGYVETVFGRRLYLPEIRSSNQQRRQGAERAAINAPMQGTAADLIKLAMIAVDARLREASMRTRLIMQVHDELVLEVPEGELVDVRERLPDLMCRVASLSVPLAVEMGSGPNWERAH
ncbi:MAG: DNA polymerase I [Proteobacteria bacterium]|nr:DNA polymerase I [Burkholderiales bacterium]